MIPLCFKCASAVKVYDEDFDCHKIVGCKENPEIENHGDACELCPLLPENQEQIRKEVERNHQQW